MFTEFFKDAIPPTAALAGPLGLYLGMLVFRYNGQGRLTKDAFSSSTGLAQIIYAMCIYAIMALPAKVNATLYEDSYSMSVWGFAILHEAIPQFIAQFSLTFLLPLLTTTVISYPHVKQDE